MCWLVEPVSSVTFWVSMVRLAPVRHGIPGVHDQVDDHLLQLRRVRLDLPERRLREHGDLDMLADEAGQHPHDLRECRVEIE